MLYSLIIASAMLVQNDPLMRDLNCVRRIPNADARKVLGSLQGRWVGRSISKGMDAQQVTRILGPAHIDTCLVFGGGSIEFWDYYRIGVRVDFCASGQAVPRVTGISFDHRFLID